MSGPVAGPARPHLPDWRRHRKRAGPGVPHRPAAAPGRARNRPPARAGGFRGGRTLAPRGLRAERPARAGPGAAPGRRHRPHLAAVGSRPHPHLAGGEGLRGRPEPPAVRRARRLEASDRTAGADVAALANAAPGGLLPATALRPASGARCGVRDRRSYTAARLLWNVAMGFVAGQDFSAR
ncbi:MAG: hypothetical protein MZV70_37495 [Desulfobacterales bacterium]|nr:hypothetical protein [Desulfobacterales bacterium]